jgi:uncharacterized protein YaaR (DUF327 family)
MDASAPVHHDLLVKLTHKVIDQGEYLVESKCYTARIWFKGLEI